jgi:hypothetical protein
MSLPRAIDVEICARRFRVICRDWGQSVALEEALRLLELSLGALQVDRIQALHDDPGRYARRNSLLPGPPPLDPGERICRAVVRQVASSMRRRRPSLQLRAAR